MQNEGPADPQRIKEYFGLDAIAADVAEEHDEIAAARGVRLAVEGVGQEVLGDPEALRRAVANLVDNAIRVSDDGGIVTIRYGISPGGAWIEVADRGPGIPQDQQARIFERFWRADESRARSSGGAGLGLAIVRRIVESHGGRVTLVSAPGEGSRFTIHLPAVARTGSVSEVVPTA